MAMQKIPLEAQFDWVTQAMTESVSWHEANKHFEHAKILTVPAYQAGFKDGWRECLSALKLHGYLAK
jgi:hypothetical protein